MQHSEIAETRAQTVRNAIPNYLLVIGKVSYRMYMRTITECSAQKGVYLFIYFIYIGVTYINLYVLRSSNHKQFPLTIYYTVHQL